MSADEILRKIPSPGGGVEVRFAHAKLSELSVAERQNLAKRMTVDNNTPLPPTKKPSAPSSK